MLRGKKGRDPLQIELYGLKQDVSESRDVASANPEIVARIWALMKREYEPSEIFKFRGLD